MDEQDMTFELQVEEMKEAIRQGRWNDISSQVWGDKQAQRALSSAARAGNLSRGDLPPVVFEKDEDGSIVLTFQLSGQDKQIRF